MKARIALLILVISAAACATILGKNSEESKETAGKNFPAQGNSKISVEQIKPDAESSVDISYVLARSQYRLIAQGRGSSFSGKSFLDREILKEKDLPKESYLDFLKKAVTFAQNHQGTAVGQIDESVPPCRTPFTVTIRVGSAVQTTNGCRSTDAGNLSRLVRDGEQLLYSKKP